MPFGSAAVHNVLRYVCLLCSSCKTPHLVQGQEVQCKGRLCTHHGQEEASNLQEALPRDKFCFFGEYARFEHVQVQLLVFSTGYRLAVMHCSEGLYLSISGVLL